jgi:purine-binding chemotaxis protein CheW
MDLAKIRKKTRIGRPETAPVDVPHSPGMPSGAPVPTEQEVAPRPPAADTGFAAGAMDTTAEASVPPSHEAPRRPRRTGPFDPIEAILAGRAAAGCNDDPDVEFLELVAAEVNDFEEFLCFRVSDEIYGINIMQIKEIIKPREVTEVPRSPSFVSGVISLRGVIIPILDMLDRLGLSRGAATGRERVVVVKHGEAFTGLLVDEVTQVVRIAKNSVEPAPAVLEAINREFVAGIGRSEGRMIILLNLDTIADIDLF